ncbi:MAG: cysteine peptidase family C39 domain-containing protein [Terriglobia bacterium]
MGRTAFALALCLSLACVAAVPAGIYLDVPYVRQPKDGCGAACISMILQYWSRHDPAFQSAPPGVASIQRALYDPEAHGIFARGMESYLRREGFRVIAFRGDWTLLQDHLSQGRPLVVCLREGSALHYVVVVGLDPARNVVLVNDPAGRKLAALHRATFEKKWSAEGDWTLLALPQSKE